MDEKLEKKLSEEESLVKLQEFKRFRQEIIALLPREQIARDFCEIIEKSKWFSFFNERAKKEAERLCDGKNKKELEFKLALPITEELLAAFNKDKDVVATTNSYVNFKNEIVMQEILNSFADKLGKHANEILEDSPLSKYIREQLEDIYQERIKDLGTILVSNISRVLVSPAGPDTPETFNLVIVEIVL